MGRIVKNFNLDSLESKPIKKTALLINPPIYDTQYWCEWSQPYGLLRIASLLKIKKYKRIELYDFLETNEKRKVDYHRISPDENYSENGKSTKSKPLLITKGEESINLFWRHFGKSWEDFEEWLDLKGFDKKHPPSEIFISAIMTYWWEAVRDLTIRLKNRYGKKTKIILGGIYPSLIPEHAAKMTQADIIVEGEIHEANDLWTDLSLYERTPTYSIITPSRGCPFNCSYCAQLKINAGSRKVRFKSVQDIVNEMKYKYETYEIRDFAFYADFLLWDFNNNIVKVLEEIIKTNLPFRLYAPEGLDTKFLSSSQYLCDLLKESNFQKIYLPVESIDDDILRSLNRRHVKLEHFVKATKMIEKAGFSLRNLEVNSFVLYGLPEEKIDYVVKTIIFVSEIVGSIIPMLFSPVPTTGIYQKYLSYFKEKGWDNQIQKLNGKLYPFLQMNEGSLSDYIDLQRLMFMLNSHYRSSSFSLFGATRVNNSFRENLNNHFESTVRVYKEWDFINEEKPTNKLKKISFNKAI